MHETWNINLHPLQGGDDFETLGFWVVPELEEEVGGLERLANWTSIGPLSRGMPNPPRKVLDYSMTQDDRETPIFSWSWSGTTRMTGKANLGVYSTVSRKAVIAPPLLKVCFPQVWCVIGRPIDLVSQQI